MFNHPPVAEPRASRILVPGRDDLSTELWMGGAHSLHGALVTPEDLYGSWVIDLAGEMPAAHRAACAHWMPRVFADVEAVPHDYRRLAALVESISGCLSGVDRDHSWPHPSEAPRRLYVMCQQGMNRSGLLTGLILRSLGVAPDLAMAAVGTRPGALTNQTYVRLILEWPHGPIFDQAER